MEILTYLVVVIGFVAPIIILAVISEYNYRRKNNGKED